MFSRLHRRRSNLQDLGRLSKSCPAVDSEAGDDDESEETSSSESWGSAASLSDPFAESSEEVAAPISRAEKQVARQSLRHAKKRETQKKRNLEQNKISMDDYLGKQAHFRMWLQEEQKKQAKDLSSPKRKTYFKMFVRLWNKRHLPPKYYETRMSWHTEGEGTFPAEKRSPLGPERFSLLQNSPAMDPTLFPHTIDLSSDSIALPAASPSSFSTFGKSTPLSASLPFKFTGTDGKKAVSEHMVTPRSAAAHKRVFKFGEDKENRAHHSLPACMATAEHLRTATISPHKKMMSACQARSLDRVVVNWSPRGQLKLNPVDSPRCPSPFASHHPSPNITCSTTTTASSKEEAAKAGSASASPLISDVYHQVKDILPSSSPVYAELPVASGVDDGLQLMPVPPVQTTTKSKVHRRRSRSVDEVPLYAVPSKQVRDRAWSEKRPVSEEVDSKSPPPIPPKRFDPHVEGLGIPFSPPVLVQKVNTNNESQVNEKGGDGGVGGKENAKKSGKMFKFSWFGKKLTSRRRSRSCEALSPSVQRAEETSPISPFPLVKLDRSPTLSRRVLTRPLKPPGKQPEVSHTKQTGSSSPLPQAMEKNPEISLMNQFDVTQEPSSQAGEADKQANSKPPHKLKFELTEYSSSPMRLGGGDRLVTFGVTGERSKRGTPLRRRSRSLEHIPSLGQDGQLKSVNVCEQVPEDSVRCELYDEVKLEVRNELSSLVNKLQQRSGVDLTQTPYHNDHTTSVEELQSSPKRFGKGEKPEKTSSPERMDPQVLYPEVDNSEGGVRYPPCVPDGGTSQSYPGAQQILHDYHVTDNDVVMKDRTEEEEPAVASLDPEHYTELQCTGSADGTSNQSNEGTAELQCTHNTKGLPQQKSYVEIVDMQSSRNVKEMPQQENSEEMTDVPCIENIKESPQQNSIEETNGEKVSEIDDNTATPLSLKMEQAHVPESPNEPLMELTNAIHSILQTYTHLPLYTDLGLGEGLSASSPPQSFLPSENSSQEDIIQPKPVSCETPSQKKIMPLVCETPSQKEVVRHPSHHEEVAFSVTVPTAQHFTEVTKPLTPRKRGPQRRRSRSVDMSLSGFGSVQTLKIQAHTSSSVQAEGEDRLSSETTAKKSSAEQEQPVNEAKKSDIIHPVVQVCKQPPPILPKTRKPPKSPMFTENKAMSINDDSPHTLPKTPTPVKTQVVTDSESTSQSVMDHRVTPVVVENASVSAVSAVQHGGPWRPVTRSRNRRRSRSVGDLTAKEGKESGVDTGEGKGFANVRAFWDSMRGRAGEEKGSGTSLQRKPSTMRRLQQQLFGTKEGQGGKELASHPQPPVTPQHLNVVQSIPSSDQAEASSAVTKVLPPPCERNTVSAKDTTTVQEVSQTKSCTQDNVVQKLHQPVTHLEESKAVSKMDTPVPQPGAEHVPPSLPNPEIEPTARPHHCKHPAEQATQERSAGKEEEKGMPIHRSPFVTVRRQSSRKRSMLSESDTPGTGSPHWSLDSPQEHHQAHQEQSRCHTSASVSEGNSTPTYPTQAKSLEGSGNHMKTDPSFGADLKATPLRFTNLEPHRDQGEPLKTQTACSVKKKPQPPKPPPKPALCPFKEAASQRQCLNSPRVLSTCTGLSSREQCAVAAMTPVSGGVRTRKRRSQELEQAVSADKQRAAGNMTNKPVFKMATYDSNSLVSSHPASPHNSHCSDGHQEGEKASVDTAIPTRTGRVKRRSGDEQDECDLRPVKRRSSGKDKDDHVPPAVTRRQSGMKTQPAPSVVTERKESLKREDRQSPIGQRVNRGGKPSPAQNNTKTDPAAAKGQMSGKDPSVTPTPKWSSVRAPVTTSDSSRTSIGTARRSSGRATVTPHNSTRTSIGSRQSNSRVTVTRQVSSKSSTGRRQSGAGETPGKVDSSRQSGGRGTPVRRESDRRQSGAGKTPTRDGNRRQSGGRGTPTRNNSDRRESGVQGTVTRTNSSRAQGSGANRPQGQVSTPVRTSSSARRRSGVGGAATASKRCSTGGGKSRRDSGGVKRSDSSRGHKVGDTHSNTPSRSGSVRKQGPKTSQSPTFMRITRTLGVYEEQDSDVHENHFTLDEEQTEKIIAGLQKAQEKASELSHHDKAMIQNNQHGVQTIPPMQAGPGKTAQPVTGLDEDEGQRGRVEDMETDIDTWEEGGLSSGAREVCTTALFTLV